MNNKKINKYIPEILALILYMVFMMIIMYFHEPWFDEAQAWLIARDASLKEILFVLPHYEGHPPIWHLILLPFAKLGAPYELSIKMVSLTFCSIAMGLFIFKSPFKRIVRLTVPFTYFFFYQYGVISRPYCVLMLGFILCGMFYTTKEAKPFRFIIALGILCSASAYGIIISAGIAIAWLIEIFYKDFSTNSIKKFCYDKRFFALLILLIFNLMLVISIIPKPDTYAMTNVVKNNDYINRFIYMFFVLPGDATYLDICNYFTTKLTLNIESAIGIVGSSIISLLLIVFTKRNNKLLVLLIPYSFIGIFSTFVYFNPHHVGIITAFFLFVIWICYEDKKVEDINFKFLNRLARKESDIRLLNSIPKVLFGIIIGISMVWTIISSVNEIYVPYGVGRNLAQFIKENNLDKYHIMAQWKQYTNNETKKTIVDTNLIGGTDTLPYFNKNIYYNLNNNIPNKCFVTHMVTNNDENIKEWKKIGFPDVIIGSPDLRVVFGNSLSYKDYVCVYDAKGAYIWKSEVTDYDYLVYIKKDIMDQFPNLKEIEP
ncbi:hypothetical protein [Clostridium sp.]|uniref:hypothetical protein n=1 Tax=Clostridium sp. TaxID=1506 RepID=UPI00283C3207|nr:hypothetical protein [Clostridium sp.]MDR3598282.1 hypothetical protein [Clostridium sp.]